MKLDIYIKKKYCNFCIEILDNMDTEMGADMDTSISTDPEELILDYSAPTLIDVIDLTKESPRNRSSLLPSCHGWTENASNHITRSSRRNSHRNVLPPIVLRGQNTQMFVHLI